MSQFGGGQIGGGQFGSGQFGGAARHDDYDFFTAPPRPATPNQFGAGPPTAGQFGGPPPARHAPPRRPPGASGGRPRIVVPLLVAVLVLAATGVAAARGLLPGVGANGGTATVAPPTGDSADAATPPKRLLGLTLSSGPRAKQIDAAFRSGGRFGEEPITTFVYVDRRHAVRVFGATLPTPLTGADRRALLAGATSSLSADGEGISVGTLNAVGPGKGGGSMRCARLGTVPASTECVFTDGEASGVVVVLGRTGSDAHARARTVREAVVGRH
jgi:hypothetical protein